MTIAAILLCLLVFVGLVFGLGLGLVAGLPLRPDEKVCAAAAAALITIYLVAFGIYLANWPPSAFIALPVAALALGVARIHRMAGILRESAAVGMLGSWLLAAGWILGFLALVRNYSGCGSGITGDWMEHYQRAQFFLFHQPLDTTFIWRYSLPARPPLANLATGALLALTATSFPYYQVFSALESSLVLLPALLFTRWMTPAPQARRWLLLFFMLNPLVLHNATYPWTKLITAFFVLFGLYLFVRNHETHAWRMAAAGFICLAAGFLSHFSAGPYLLALAIAWFWWRRRQWRCRRFWIESAGCAACGGLLLASWFAWAIHHYGRVTTFLANTAVQGLRGSSPASLLAGRAANIFYTVIPYPLRHAPEVHPALRSPAVVVRDFTFKLYQLNLFLALGSVGGLLVAWLLWQQWKKFRVHDSGLPRTFWLYFVAFCAVAGIAVDGEVNTEGIAHICLQPLIVLGLAFVAAHFTGLRRHLRLWLLAGLAVDFTLGIGLQFYIEHLDRPFGLWLVDAGRTLTVTDGYALAVNVLGKHVWGCRFVGDGPMAPPALIVALLGSLLALALALPSRGPAAQIAAGEWR